MVTLVWFAFFIVLLPVGYLFVIALFSMRSVNSPEIKGKIPSLRFAIVIPAHNEENVIGDTVARLRKLDFPGNLFDLHVIADHCTDRTSEIAYRAGAIVHERSDGPRTGKGAVLSWIFKRILADDQYDAVVVFDADTQVDANFLRFMDARLAQGNQAVQGQHIISNSGAGWFPALTGSMFLVDNRFQNKGRSNLGWSAKNMGDSICCRSSVLREIGWGEGLTEDYQLRQRLLLEGIKIVYEPRAKGYGESPLSWEQAHSQRSRWLRGTRDASQQFARQLLINGIKQRDGALLDGAMQAYFPSYSTLTLISIMILTFQLIVNWAIQSVFPASLIAAWSIVLWLLFLYPLLGLALEGAPLRAYLAILSGPIYILWRTWLAFASRFGGKQISWIRTDHGTEK